jgi:hypothetical protein
MRPSAVRLGLLLVTFVLGACSTAAPSAPGDTGLVGTPAPGTPTPSRRTILVDTDVAADDLVALAFLLSSREVDLAGITVSGTGEAHCADGVDVVLRLLDRPMRRPWSSSSCSPSSIPASSSLLSVRSRIWPTPCWTILASRSDSGLCT